MKHYMIKKIIPISQTNCFFEMPITKLRENEYIVCEGILSEYECKNALDQMSSNKSPWSDGQLNSTKHSGTK